MRVAGIRAYSYQGNIEIFDMGDFNLEEEISPVVIMSDVTRVGGFNNIQWMVAGVWFHDVADGKEEE